MPGTHHTALYQTEFIRATKKKKGHGLAARPPPSLGARGCSTWTPSPEAARDVSRWPARCLGGRHEAEGANALSPHCGWGRVLPRERPWGLLSPHSKVTIAELPLSCRNPFPTAARAQLSAPLPWAARRGAAGHADRDKRTEQETRQHLTAALARLGACLALPRRSPHRASVMPAPAIR